MRFLFPAVLLLITMDATAQWTTPDVNTRVSGSGSVGAATPLSAPGPDGSTYITWFEAASGYRLMMQRLDAAGVPMWEPGGIVVSAEAQNSALFRFDFSSDHAGNAIVAFQDERSGSLDVVAYRVAPDGSMLWGNGISLATPGATGLAPTIGILSDNRVVIAWNTSRSPATVAYRVLPASGMPENDVPAEIGGTGIHGRPRVVGNADGGFWLQYVQQPGNFLSPGTLLAKRFDTDAAEVLTATISTATITGFYFPRLISDGHNGFYIAFNSGNAANQNMTDVYVQRVRADGSRWSATGTPVEVGATTNRYANNTAPALIGEAEGLMIAYSRKNGQQSEGGVNVQRFDTAGTALLGPTGAEVVAATTALAEPFGTMATTDGAVFGCTLGGFGNETAMAFEVGLSGAVVQPPGVVTLAATPSGIDDAGLVPFHLGQAVAVWQDDRHGGSIMAQPIQIDFSTDVTTHHDMGVVFLSGPDAALLFHTGLAGEVEVTALTTDGRRLAHRRLNSPQAGARVSLGLPATAFGVLLLEVRHSGARTVLRVVR